MNNLTDKLSLKNNKPMKPFNRNFLTTSSKIFEKQTMLSQSVISSDIIMLDSATKSLLQQSRVKYQRQIIKFENSKTNAKFLTSKKSSFEALTIDNKIALHLSKLTPGTKQPDEFYLDTKKRNAFIIEKKTQSTSGSVDEKLQTAVFKRYVLSKKFKKG